MRNIYQRMAVAMVLAILLVTVGSLRAQDAGLDETYIGNGVQFDYPSGWVVVEGDGFVAVYSQEPEEDSRSCTISPVASGEVAVYIGTARNVMMCSQSPIAMSVPEPSEGPTFNAAYAAGITTLGLPLTLGRNNTVSTFEIVASGQSGDFATVEMAADPFGSLYIVAGESDTIVFGHTPVGELDDARGIIEQIAASLEITAGRTVSTEDAETMLRAAFVADFETANAFLCEDEQIEEGDALPPGTELLSLECSLEGDTMVCPASFIIEGENFDISFTFEVIDGLLCDADIIEPDEEPGGVGDVDEVVPTPAD